MKVWSIEWLILAYFVISMTWNYAQMILARGQLKYRRELADPEDWPSITLLIPALNEEVVISETVDSMLALDYPGDLRISICDDGSTDDTFSLLVNRYDLNAIEGNVFQSADKRVLVVRQENAGRAAALNTALKYAGSEYIVATDADTLLDSSGIRRIVKEMIADSKLEAVGGTIMLANNIEKDVNGTIVGTVPPHPVTGTQSVEYLRAFLYGRLGLNRLGGNVIISGAFGVFRRDTLNKIGGWNKDTVAEDFDLTIRIREHGGKVLFVPDPVAWTEAPETLRELGRQRERWHRGLCQVLFGPARRMYFRRKYGLMGSLVLPMYFITEWMAPLVEVLGFFLIAAHIGFANLGLVTAGLIFTGAFIIGVTLSIISIWFEQSKFRRYIGLGDTVRLVKYSLLEPLWYRPLTIYWRLKGLVNYLRGKKAYGEMARKGFFTTATILALAGMFPLISPSVLEGQNWAEVESYVEAGEVSTRVDIAARIKVGPVLGGAIRRERNNIYDTQIFGVGTFVVKSLILSIGYAASTTNDIFPAHEAVGSIGFIAGHFVNTTGVRVQEFQQDELKLGTLVLVSNTLEYYIGDWRLAGTGMIGDRADIWAAAGFLSRYYNRWNFTIYGSTANELLDVPRIVGRVKEAGGVVRVRVAGPLELSGVLAYGERLNKTYYLTSIGLRMYF